MVDKNLAYDIQTFEEEIKRKKNNIIKLPFKKRRLRAKKQSKIILTFVSLVASTIAASFIAMFLNSRAQLTELTDTENKLSKNLSEQKSISTQLEMKKAASSFDENINSGTNDLRYVKINLEDKVDIK